MKFGALFVPFIFMSFATKAGACEYSAFNSCRDSFTKNISERKTEKARKEIDGFAPLSIEIGKVFRAADKSDSHNDLFKDLIKISYLKEDYESCLSSNWFRRETQRKIHCVQKTVEDPIYYAYSRGHLDATATIILLSKIQNKKKAAVTGRFGAYAHKVELLRNNYLANQGAFNDGASSPLSKKKYLEKFGKLKKLTPRQKTLLKYNYTQIKLLGDILIEFDKRVQAASAGIFYDFDGDGDPDDVYVLDPAEQYRATVKLLKLRLEKESRSGGPFYKNRPDFNDLLVAGNELGLISDKDLEAMIELPHLYEEGTPFWEKAGKIAWEVGKGVIMAVPGVNLYAIVPIVLVESYRDSKERADETSDLHLFTF